MYAIIESGGKQYKVQPGQIIAVEKLEADEGPVTFDHVLMCSDGETVTVGSPTVEKAAVTGEVLGTTRGDKVVAYKVRRRKDTHRKIGHRQTHTNVRIDEIKLG